MRPAASSNWRRWVSVLLAAILGGAVLMAVVLDGGDPPPRSVLAGQFPDVAIEDLEIDPASGLPILPVSAAEGPWWWLDAPDQALDPEKRFASAAPTSSAADRTGGGVTPLTSPGVTLLASFPDHAAARSVAEGLASAVGDPAAEAAWLVEAGQAEGGGFEWLGSDAATSPFVQVIDRWLLVSGLAYDQTYDAWDESPSGGPVYRSPLTLALVELADSVLAEGDRSGEGTVAFDVSCRGTPEQLRTGSQDLADHGLGPDWQPPWLAPGITADQRRARRTLRLVRQLQGVALGRVLVEDAEFERLDRALAAAADSGDADRIRAASSDLVAYIGRALPVALPDLGPVASALDPEIVAAEVAEYVRLVVGGAYAEVPPYVPPTEDERRQAAEPFGPSQAPIPWRSGDALFEVGLEGDQLSLFVGSWMGIAEGLGSFVDYLAAAGCTDLEFAFLDFDDVRGD